MIFFDAFLFLILLVIAVWQTRSIITTKRPSTAGLFYLVVFIIYGLPLIYKYFLPSHGKWFAAETEDPAIQWRYNVILIIGILLVALTNIRGPAKKSRAFSRRMADINFGYLKLFATFSWLLLLLPLVVVIVLAPDKLCYLKYGTMETRGIVERFAGLVYSLVGYAVSLAFVGYVIIRLYNYHSKGYRWNLSNTLATLFLLIGLYLNTKRTVIMMFLLTLGVLHLLEKGSRKILIVAVPIALVVFFIHVNVLRYQTSFVDFIRGDLSRDYTLCYTIAYTHPASNDIIPQRANSFRFLATAYIPRVVYPDKVWPTSVYFTQHVHRTSLYEILPWGYGVGYYEEFLLNLGYLGLLLFIPLGLWFRFVDYLIYYRSMVCSIIWLPILYNIMFASNAALVLYVTIVVPVLVVSTFLFRKPRYVINSYEAEQLEYGGEYLSEYNDQNEIGYEQR